MKVLIHDLGSELGKKCESKFDHVVKADGGIV